jgi:ribosomal protein S18 acetylase RimI-like enzyme
MSVSEALGQRAANRRAGLIPASRLAVRVHPAPHDARAAHVTVIDPTAIATVDDYTRWQTSLSAHGFTRLRTGALAARAAEQAERAGLQCVQELALLEAVPPFPELPAVLRTSRSRHADEDELARIDCEAFGREWHLDRAFLADVRGATPSARSRVVRTRALPSPDVASSAHSIAGFLVTGRAARVGYLQRLAVDPQAQRRGVATALVADAMGWLRRRGVARVFVNTRVDNAGALELYRRAGFVELQERLRVFEGATSR